MATLSNVPSASAHGRCTAAALSCIQWKAHHKFHVPHDIEYLQLQLQLQLQYVILVMTHIPNCTVMIRISCLQTITSFIFIVKHSLKNSVSNVTLLFFGSFLACLKNQN